jgi:hypothetical protein
MGGTGPAIYSWLSRILKVGGGQSYRSSGQVKRLVDEDFPLSDKIVLVMDNLNTYTIASLYETFPAEEARRGYGTRREIHYTPKQGSWLNRAEIELNAINNQGLSEGIPSYRADEGRYGGMES